MNFHKILFHIVIAIIIPVIATILQYWLSSFIPKTIWLLLYPAVLFSAWIGGLIGGIVATISAAFLGIYVFIPPHFSWTLSDPRHAISVGIFITMGVLFGLIFEKLKRNQQLVQSLADSQIKSDQERLALALATSHAGLWEWNLADNQITWSDSLRKLYGVDQSMPASYDNWLSTVHPDDQASVIADLMQAVKQGQEFSLEWRVAHRPIDQPRWLLSNGKPFYDQTGKAVFYRGVILDVTQQKQQQQALRESEREFRLLAEAMPQIVWITRADGWNIFFNQQWVDYTGLTLEQSYGHGWNIPFHPNDQQLAWDAWQNAVLHQAVYSLECRLRRHDGVYRWWLIRGIPIKNEQGGIKQWFGTCTDIHDIKLTQEKLRLSEQRYRQLFEANPLPIWIFNTDTLNIQDANEAAMNAYGYSHEEFLALSIQDIYPPEAMGLFRKYPAEFHQKHPVFQHRRKDGGLFWSEVASHQIQLDAQPAQIILARDITLQLESERKLQESEARWQFALEGSDQGVWDWNINTGEVFFSKRWKSMLGYNDDEIPNRLEEWQQRVHPDDIDWVMAAVASYFRGETSYYSSEHRVQHRNGDYIWILDRGMVVLRDAQGNPSRMIGTHQDITARKKIEQELIDHQVKLSLFIEHAPAALAMFDLDMCYLAVSNRWIEDYHLQGQTIIGRCHYEVFPEIGEEWKAVHRRALSGEVIKADLDHFVRSNGEEVWQRWEVRPWYNKDEKIGGIAIFTEDITQQTLIDRERQRWADAFQHCSQGVAIGNPITNTIEFCNPAFAALLGYTTPQALQGQFIPALYAVDNRDEIISYLQTADRLGQIRYESKYRHLNGSSFDVQVDIVSVKASDGDILYRVATVHDISQRKLNEQELQQHRFHLERLVMERTAQLDEARQEAEHLATVKSHFLANMSHEIRTPMNAVLGFCYLLEQSALDRNSLELVHKIHNAGNSLLNIINDILDFSKLEVGRLEIETQPFHLSDLLDELAALISSLAHQKNLQIIFNPAPNVDGLLADKQHLQQVVLNLLGNAIKFTAKGEVELRIEVITQPNQQEALQFSIRDTGIGISSDMQTQVFSAFTQADTSISRRFGGTGLGLAISYRLVELMGGQLKVNSQEGMGSEFYFQIPLHRTELPSAFTALKPLRVLIADSSPTARAGLTNTIKSLGWLVEAVDSGELALRQVLQAGAYDVLLLDGATPKSSLQMIQQALSSQSPVLILIMTTAHDEETLWARAERQQISNILSKPVTASSLYKAVAERLLPIEASPLKESSHFSDDNLSISGLSVLLVDDSEINLELAKTLLENHGAIVHTASNGQIALDWLNEHPEEAHIVLMDVQMPLMDGYTACRHIRQDTRWQKLPIIALSAGVLKNEQVQAIAAGMNDFVSKPFNVEHLLTTIQRLTGQQINEQTGIEPVAKLPTASNPGKFSVQSFNSDSNLDIDFAEGTRQWGQVDVYKTYLQKFIDNYASSGHEIAHFLAEYDEAAALQLAHKLKGVAANLALKKVASQAGSLEADLKQGQFSFESIDLLQLTIDQACEAIKVFTPVMNESNSSASSELNPANSSELIELLEQLLTALDQDNPVVVEPLLLKFQGVLPEQIWTEIQAKVSDFDFRGSEALVSTLLNKIKSNPAS